VVLRIDSPGGEVYGMLDTARSIRKRVEAAGKTLTAYVDGEACSAAYALACVAARIVVAQSAFVGSIGIIESRIDASRLDAASGISYALTTSGDRKADRHPHEPLTEAELASAQQRVDSLAAVFFELVAEFRPPTAEAIRGLQAEVFHGDAAIAAGLADQVTTFDDLLAQLSGEEQSAMPPNAESPSAEAPKAGEDLDAARAALEKAAASDDKDDAAKAKKALAALDAAEGGDDEDEKESDDAEDEEPDEDAEKKGDEPAAARSASSDVALATTVQTLSAELAQFKAERLAEKRRALFASRPDLAPELVAAIKDLPLAKIKEIVAGVKPSKTNARGASVTPGAVRGAGQGDGEPIVHERSAELDAAFGTGTGGGITKVGNKKSFGVLSPEAARAAVLKSAAASKGAV
jgi:ClpP class serine protease